MGCTSGKYLPDDDNLPRIFKVVSMDKNGCEVKSGEIEVRDGHLVFYENGKKPIQWPLSTLPSYGCDGDVFTFESGRRSPTGPGVFLFRCRQASILYAHFLDCLNRETAGHQDNTYVNVNNHDMGYDNVQNMSYRSYYPENDFKRSYVKLRRGSSGKAFYMRSISDIENRMADQQNNNLQPTTPDRSLSRGRCHSTPDYYASRRSLHGYLKASSPEKSRKESVKYAVLDFPESETSSNCSSDTLSRSINMNNNMTSRSCCVSTGNLSCNHSGGSTCNSCDYDTVPYARIDHEKTLALANSVRHRGRDDGSRRTRHSISMVLDI